MSTKEELANEKDKEPAKEKEDAKQKEDSAKKETANENDKDKEDTAQEPETTKEKEEEPEDNKGDTEEESETDTAPETAVETAKQDMIDNLKEDTQGNVEDAFALDDELPFNMDDIEVPENEEKAEFVEMLMNVMHAAITIYLAINYWYTYLPNTAGQPFDRQLICRAAHLTVMPLFKPVSIAMWPALMPLLQFAHWQATRKKSTKMVSSRGLNRSP